MLLKIILIQCGYYAIINDVFWSQTIMTLLLHFHAIFLFLSDKSSTFFDSFMGDMMDNFVGNFSAHDRNTKLNLANAYQIKNEAID